MTPGEMAGKTLKYTDINLSSGEPIEGYTWSTVEIPMLRDDETIADLKWIKNDRLYIKTSSGRWLLSKDGGETWQVPRGPLPKRLKLTLVEVFYGKTNANR